MDLDLERFWATVRSKRRKPRPALCKAAGPMEIWVEAVESYQQTSCSPKVRVQLTSDSASLKCDIRFPSFTTEARVHGVNIYATSRAQPLFVPCDPRHLYPGDTLTLTLYFSDGTTLARLKQLGLKPSVV